MKKLLKLKLPSSHASNPKKKIYIYNKNRKFEMKKQQKKVKFPFQYFKEFPCQLIIFKLSFFEITHLSYLSAMKAMKTGPQNKIGVRPWLNQNGHHCLVSDHVRLKLFSLILG